MGKKAAKEESALDKMFSEAYALYNTPSEEKEMASMIKPVPKSYHGKTIAKSSGKDAAAGAKTSKTGTGKMAGKPPMKKVK
jgi:hypothetical protein